MRLAVAMFASTAARANVVASYSNFCGASGLTLVGNTAITSGGALRLTTNGGGEAGAAYSTTPITLGANATFSTTFQFQITQPGGIDPADGIVFVLAANATGLGVRGAIWVTAE
jgi:hypothetical protein